MNDLYSETAKMGKRGVFTIPASLRKRFGLSEGSLLVAEEREDGILLRPAPTMPVEIYTDERIAEFLLTNTVDNEDYLSAREEVKALGLDPDAIPHKKPA